MFSTIFYILVFAIAVSFFALIKKGDNAVNIVSELILSGITIICIDTIAALFLTIADIPVCITSIMMIHILIILSSICIIKITGTKQCFFINGIDILFIVILALIAVAMGLHIFNGFTIGYNSGDSATHFSYAMRIVRTQRVSSMYLNALYNAVVIELMAPFVKASHYYVGMEIADTTTFLLLIEMIYIVLSSGLRTTKEKSIAFLLTIMCLFGYPLTGYMVGGYSYLTCSLMIVCYVLYYLKSYINATVSKYIGFIFMILGIIGVAFSYMLFAPFIFIGVVLSLYYNDCKKMSRQEKKRTIGILTLVCLLVGIAMCIVILLYSRASGLHNIHSVLNFFLTALRADGYMYSRIFSDFLMFLPIVLFVVANSIRSDKYGYGLFIPSFLIACVVMFLVSLVGILSGYYYYKLYFVLWILCWICVGSFLFDKNVDKIIKVSYLISIIFICITSFFKIENNIYILQDSLAHHEGFTEDAKIYAYNATHLMQEYNSWWLDEDDMKAIEFSVDENQEKSSVLIGDNGKSDIQDTMISRWYSNILGHESIYLTGLSYDDFVTVVKENGYDMIVLRNDNKTKYDHEEWFDEMTILYENNTVKVLGTDGL